MKTLLETVKYLQNKIELLQTVEDGHKQRAQILADNNLDTMAEDSRQIASGIVETRRHYQDILDFIGVKITREPFNLDICHSCSGNGSEENPWDSSCNVDHQGKGG